MERNRERKKRKEKEMEREIERETEREREQTILCFIGCAKPRVLPYAVANCDRFITSLKSDSNARIPEIQQPWRLNTVPTSSRTARKKRRLLVRFISHCRSHLIS